MTPRSPTPPRDAVRIQEVEGGFPHSEILGSKLVRSSPRLIAAYHVLHRLSAPRHPPDALKTLDRSHDRCPQNLSRGANVFWPAPSAKEADRSERPVLGSLPRRFCLPNAPGLNGASAVAGSLGSSPNRPSAFPLHDVKHPQIRFPQTHESQCSKTPDRRRHGIEPTATTPCP